MLFEVLWKAICRNLKNSSAKSNKLFVRPMALAERVKILQKLTKKIGEEKIKGFV
jgi:hypothetical protein